VTVASAIKQSSAAAPAVPAFLARVWRILTLTPLTTGLWLMMIGLAALILRAAGLSLWWLPLVAYGLLAVHELLAFRIFHRGLFPSSERVARVYQWFTLFLGDHPDLAGRGDLTEGLYEGDFSKSIEQATTDKYARIVDLLELKPGHRVLDVGCGLGDFLFYLKSRGINGVGLTLSPEQQAIGRARGLDIRLRDFRLDLPAELAGRFDAVTLIGSLEHFGVSYQMGDRAAADPVFAHVFESAAAALDPASAIGRVFSTTLHSRPAFRWRPADYVHAYSFHGHYSGLYPREGDFERLCRPWFAVTFRHDATVDYQFSSISSPRHFGNFRLRWTPEKLLHALLLLLVNPFAPFSWLYHYNESWMWQFGGKDLDATNRPAVALWYVHSRL
jgi:cyclopropane fatty-acyl-phospholipid synthase-like methyltransferase